MNLKEKSKIFRIGFALTLSGCLIILFYYLMYNTSDVSDVFGAVIGAITPFIVGIVLAYLLTPIQNFFTKTFFKKIGANAKSKDKALSKSKLLAMIICMIILLGVVVGVFSLLIPSLIDTVVDLVDNLPGQINDAIAWLQENVIKTHPVWVERITSVLNSMQDSLIAWAKDSFIPTASSLVSGIYTGVTGVIAVVIDVFVGLISCVYFLLDKEHFVAQIKKIVVAIFKPGTSDKVLELGTTTHKIFGGFINGKVITSIMVGIILFFLMTIFGLPYTALSATVVGVFNIIPFFGPIIGAIPPAILILLQDPIQLIIFLILVLAVQGLDQYVLSPKIIGQNTGLSSFWVMFSILAFGSLFGFIGMVLGVPVFAVIYTYFSRFVSNRLSKKELSVETEDYKNYEVYGVENNEKFIKEVKKEKEAVIKAKAEKRAKKEAAKKAKKKGDK